MLFLSGSKRMSFCIPGRQTPVKSPVSNLSCLLDDPVPSGLDGDGMIRLLPALLTRGSCAPCHISPRQLLVRWLVCQW